MRHVFQRLLLVLAGLCLLPSVGVWTGQVHWTLDLLSQFLLPSVVAACVIAIVAGLARFSLTGAGALVVAAIASVNAGPWTAAPKPVGADTPHFSVLLLNAWVRNQNLDEVAGLIKARNADIVVLVEATPRLRAAVATVAQAYPYHADCADDAGCGVIILSRARLSPFDIGSARGASLAVSVTLAGCAMPVTAVHLGRPFPFASPADQQRQAEELGHQAAAWTGAQLVLGDFNAAPWSHVTQTVLEQGRLTLLTGSGGTWPSVLPKQLRIPIDHLMAGPGLAFVRREVLGSVGSDHVPVLAEIVVTDSSKCRSMPF